MSIRSLRITAVLLLLLAVVLVPRPAGAYAVLSHEEIVDMVWAPQIVPMLKMRYHGITDEQIQHAHAYAYGGSVIQDIGYYPFGSKYFSDLLHYVRSGDFVEALIRDSVTPDEYAFALGALAHYSGDVHGHPHINHVTALENPKLKTRFGDVITYEQDETAHLRTEFGFDVAAVANGFYSQKAYRDFIGFQVAKPLLERAFHETYGIEMSDVIRHEDLAISSYRFSVAHLIPRITRVALSSYHGQIEQAHPGFDRNKFLYRYNRTEFEQDYGVKYQRPSLAARVVGLFVSVLPKIGPLKALRLTIPDADEQAIYLRSINETVDSLKLLLAQVHAPETALPVEVIAAVDPKTAQAASAAAASQTVSPVKAPLIEDARKNDKRDAVEKADKTAQKTVAEAVKQTTQKAAATVDAIAGKDVPAASKATVDLAKSNADAVAAKVAPTDGSTLQPTSPSLRNVDLDTGKPTMEGEYRLSDETYAKLVEDLTHEKSPLISPELRKTLLAFYAGAESSRDNLKDKPAQWQKLERDLAAFRLPPVAHVGTVEDPAAK